MLRCLNQLFMYSFRDPPSLHTITQHRKKKNEEIYNEQGNCEFLNQCSPLTVKYDEHTNVFYTEHIVLNFILNFFFSCCGKNTLR